MATTSPANANDPCDRLRAAWTAYRPVPDLSSLIDDGARGDAAARSESFRIDASHRAVHRDPIRREEDTEAVGPLAMAPSGVLGPDIPLTRVVLVEWKA